MTLTRRLPLLSGAIIPVVFWGTLALCASRLDGYSHLGGLVSDLGAAGTPTRGLFAAGLLACSALSLVFIAGLCRECRCSGINPAPVLILLTFPLSIAGAAIFPLPSPLHGILGSPAVLLFLSPLLALVDWKGEALTTGMKFFAALSLLLLLLGFLAFFPQILPAYPGFKQRIAHVGWSMWFLTLGIGCSRFNRPS